MIAPIDLEVARRLFVIAPEDETFSPDQESREPTPLDAQSIADDLGPDGPLAAQLSTYEDRPSQREMAATIAELYNDGGVGLLEAGTGVGKSLGYLVPALRWAAQNGERTVVSTNTINLQEQLVRKDLPFLARALQHQQPVRFALLKGWRNYLCKLRFAQVRMLGPSLLDHDATDSIERIAQWMEETDDGSISDLPEPPGHDLWDEISAEPDLCTRSSCSHYQHCFVFKARRLAAQADIVVANHHLLMSDVAVRRAKGNWSDAAVIPPYGRVVIDEGHHLEDAAAAHLGFSVTRRGFQRQFARLDRRGKGLIAVLMERLSARDDLLSLASRDLIAQRIAPAVRSAREKGELVFNLLQTLLTQDSQTVLRLDDTFATHRIWANGLHIALTDTLRELSQLCDSLALVKTRLESIASREESMAALINELRGVGRRLEAMGEALRIGLRPPADLDPHVRWIDVRGREGNLGITAVPLDLAPILRHDLFDRVETAVITSATLSATGRFDFLARRLGLAPDTTVDPENDTPPVPLITKSFPSPFDYPRQSLLLLPTDIPLPNADPERHAEALVMIVTEMAEAAQGGVFVLCTSHRDVRHAASQLRAQGIDAKFPVLVHGEQPRDVLLTRFKEAGNAILLGTTSYWEGVDVPGAALRGLVIARLPFRVPSEPVTAAQCEAIEARGGDAFHEYMLPHAALRLKQGFGRLIRSAGDSGVVVLTDPRVVSKGYGRRLIAALPPARRKAAVWSTLRHEMRIFYERHVY